MKCVYLIAAHTAGDQLELLLDRLLPRGTPDVAILHLDAKSDLWRLERARFAEHQSGRVRVVSNPARVYWSHASQLTATLRMLDVALDEGFDLAHHMSGQDWPIASRATIINDHVAAGHPAHIDILGPLKTERMQDWWFDVRRPVSATAFPWLGPNVGRAQERLSWGFSRLARRVGLVRSTPFGPWQKGWSWWSVPPEIATVIRDGLRQLFHARRLHFTQCPDEHATATIVHHRGAGHTAPYRREIIWREGAYNPEILTRDDLPRLMASNAWFARKFDLKTDDFFLSAFPPFT